MENASKALLIAGGVLLAMLILGIAVFLRNNYQDTANQYVTVMETTKLSEYNSKFTVYEGRDDITPQELVTLCNFVKNYDQSHYATDIKIKIGVDTKNQNDFDIEYLKLGNFGSDIKFKCTDIDSDGEAIDYDATENFVTEIEFKKN